MKQKSQFNQLHYVRVRQVTPSQYEFSISHPSTLEKAIVMVCQFKSTDAAKLAAQHYEELVEKAYQIGYKLDGYFLYGPSGQILPVSDVFDLDMSLGHVEQRLSSMLGTLDTSNDLDFPEIQPIS